MESKITYDFKDVITFFGDFYQWKRLQNWDTDQAPWDTIKDMQEMAYFIALNKGLTQIDKNTWRK